MKALLVLLFTLLFVGNMQEYNPFSIAPFIEYIEAEGLYDLLVSVKINCGADIASKFCYFLTYSYVCEEYVLVYLPTIAFIYPPPPRITFEQLVQLNYDFLINYGLTDDDIQYLLQINQE